MIKVPVEDIFSTANFTGILRSQAMSIDGHGEADCHISLGGQTDTNAANRNQKLRFDDTATCVQTTGIYDARLRNATAVSNGSEMRVTGGDHVDPTTGDVTLSTKIYKVNENLSVSALTNDVFHVPSGFNISARGHSMMSDLINCFIVGGEAQLSDGSDNIDLVKHITRFRWDDSVAAFGDGLELRQTSGTSCCGHNGTEGIIWRSQGGGAATTTAEIFHPEKGINSRLIAELSTTFPQCTGMSACSSGDAAFRTDGFNVGSSVEVNTVRSLRYDDITTALSMSNTLAYRSRQQFTASDGRSMMSTGGRSDADSIAFSLDAQSIKFDDSATGIQHTNGLNIGIRVGACASI